MLELLIVLVVVGVLLYIVETYLPIAPPIKILIRLVAFLMVLFWILRFFHLAPRF